MQRWKTYSKYKMLFFGISLLITLQSWFLRIAPYMLYSNYIFRRDNFGEPKTKLPNELVMTQNSMYCTHYIQCIKAQQSTEQNSTLHEALTLLYSLHWYHRLLVKCFILNNLNCMPNNEYSQHSWNIVFIQDDIATRLLSFPLKLVAAVLTGVFFRFHESVEK